MSIAHFTVATRDVVRTAEFFRKALGFEPLHQAGNIDTQAAWLRIDSTTQLHILYVEGFEPSPFEREYGRHVAFFRSKDDWVNLQERLVELEAEIIQPLRETPFARFFFRDFNGYMWEVIDQDEFVEE